MTILIKKIWSGIKGAKIIVYFQIIIMMTEGQIKIKMKVRVMVIRGVNVLKLVEKINSVVIQDVIII